MKRAISIYLLLLVFLFFVLSIRLRGSKIVEMPGLLEPNAVLVDNDRLYIADGAYVFIYLLKDFSLQKKFGRAGEGIQEFREKIYTLGIQGEYITINSVGKLSFFTKDGKFVREKDTPPQLKRLKPFGNKFIGFGVLADNKALYNTLDIYDAGLNKEKEIGRLEMEIQPGKGTRVFHGALSADVWGDKLFFSGGNDFEIIIYDENGEKLRAITHEYERRKVTGDDKDRIINYLRTNGETKEYYEMLQPIKFPAYYPAIKKIITADNRVYVLTWKTINEQTECFIFDFNGKLAANMLLPIENKDAVEFAPLAVKNGVLYYLEINKNNDVWELRLVDIK
jgi:hypothetical protein